MGIPGLLPFLGSVTDKASHIQKFAGQRVGIDGYVGLQTGAHSCAFELGQGQATDKFVTFFMSRINMLLYYKVTPVVVFDGDRLPVKQVEEARASSRAENRAKALEALRDGNRAKATEFFQRCVDVTPRMAHQVIAALKRCGVEFVVAPYEADAQLAYLALRGDIACVITADSDLIPYGCTNVFLKMDKLGNGHLIEAARLGEVLHGFDADMLRIFCCLTGCDYMTPIKGLGVRGAHALVKRYVTPERIVRAVLRDAALQPPPDFELLLERALLTFRHQRVWCPTRQRIVPLTPFADAPPPADGVVPTGDYASDADTLFLGRQLPQEQALGVCTGLLEPGTLRPFDGARGAAAANSTAVGDGDWQQVTRTAAATAAAAATSSSSSSTAVIRAQTLAKAQRQAALARAGTWTGKGDDQPQQSNNITNYFTPVSKAAVKPFQPPKRSIDEASSTASTAPPVKVHVFSRFFGAKKVETVEVEEEEEEEEEEDEEVEEEEEVIEVEELQELPSSGCQSIDSPKLTPPRHPSATIVLSDDDDDDDEPPTKRASGSAVDELESFAFGGGKENNVRSSSSLAERIRASRMAGGNAHKSLAAIFLKK